MHLRAIDIKVKLLGENDYEVALSVGHLASLYNYDMYLYEKAEQLYFRSIKIGDFSSSSSKKYEAAAAMHVLIFLQVGHCLVKRTAVSSTTTEVCDICTTTLTSTNAPSRCMKPFSAGCNCARKAWLTKCNRSTLNPTKALVQHCRTSSRFQRDATLTYFRVIRLLLFYLLKRVLYSFHKQQLVQHFSR